MQTSFSNSQYSFVINNTNFRLASEIGVQPAGEANLALIQAARRTRGERVFVTGPGCTASALWAARQGVHVTLWTEHISQAKVMQRSFTMNNLADVQIINNADFDSLEIGSFSQVFVHLTRGKAIQEEQLALAGAVAKPGGQIMFVGATNEGVKGALSLAQSRFGEAGIVVKKKGFHAGMAFTHTLGALPVPDALITEIDVDEQATILVSYPGAFAPDRLDKGTAALIKGMQILPEQRVLDLGCGTGLAGLCALRRGGNVTFSDVSARAVSSANATLKANGYADAPVHLAYGAQAFAAGTFDCVITNPPFHTGHDRDYGLPRLFVSEAARVLKANGKAFIVANNFLRYEPWLKTVFQHVDIALEDSQFRVWVATK